MLVTIGAGIVFIIYSGNAMSLRITYPHGPGDINTRGINEKPLPMFGLVDVDAIVKPMIAESVYTMIERATDRRPLSTTTPALVAQRVEHKTTSTHNNYIIRERFALRKTHMQTVCKKYQDQVLKTNEWQQNSTKFSLKYINESKLVYCAIEKTGSTFWKRILHVLCGWGNASNPVDIRPEDADVDHGGFISMTNLDFSQIGDIVNSSTSIMFVRDPLTRLFSAWLDKFYSPNPYYWEHIGYKIVSKLRNSSSANSNETVEADETSTESLVNSSTIKIGNRVVKCGYDVTFKEFITFIVSEVETENYVDAHFSANYKHCMQCSYDFDYIGKYETLREDTVFLLEELNMSRKVNFTDFGKDATRDAINGLSEWVFLQKRNIENCGVSFGCALFKVFKTLQSRGIFPLLVEFPYQTLNDIKDLTQEQFERELFEASRQENDKKSIRNQSLLAAYKTIPVDLAKRLQAAFKIDFEMFQYSDTMKFLHDSEGEEINFDYFAACPQQLV
ncbi:hypothetical protein DPMN_087113 [Dreissena polymorpha]|uniref:Carbohydrate sulfotransferase n=2 Tax=Dreissena polymorpha TaxID=45954 RepID=A0A9D4QW25_DREPO|nr:hypothetical protein DPMN_087113 [Dreissena polymorpha]